MTLHTELAIDDAPLLLRVGEAARLLSISRSQAYALCAGGLLPSVKIGSAVRVPRAALLAWVEQQQRGANA